MSALVQGRLVAVQKFHILAVLVSLGILGPRNLRVLLRSFLYRRLSVLVPPLLYVVIMKMSIQRTE